MLLRTISPLTLFMSHRDVYELRYNHQTGKPQSRSCDSYMDGEGSNNAAKAPLL